MKWIPSIVAIILFIWCINISVQLNEVRVQAADAENSASYTEDALFNTENQFDGLDEMESRIDDLENSMADGISASSDTADYLTSRIDDLRSQDIADRNRMNSIESDIDDLRDEIENTPTPMFKL